MTNHFVRPEITEDGSLDIVDGRHPVVEQTMQDGGFGAMMQQFARFRQSFQGDPQAEVQRLLNSGQMTQAQYNQLVSVAGQIMPMLK